MALANLRGTAIRRTADENSGRRRCSLTLRKMKHLESLLLSRYKLRFAADEDAEETVVSRSKRQLNKRCIRFENIMRRRPVRGRPLRQGSTHKSLRQNRADRARGARAAADEEHYSRSLSRCALGLHPRPGQSRRRGTSRQTQRTRHRWITDIWLCANSFG